MNAVLADSDGGLELRTAACRLGEEVAMRLVAEQVAALPWRGSYPRVSARTREKARRRGMAHAVAGGLIVDALLGDLLLLEDGRLRPTGQTPTEPLLVTVAEAIARRRRPPRVRRVVREFAETAPRGWPAVIPVPGASFERLTRRPSPTVLAVFDRVAACDDADLARVRQPVREVLTGTATPKAAEPEVGLVAGLALTANAVRALVDVDERELADRIAANLAGGRTLPATPTAAAQQAAAALPPITHAAPLP